MKKRGVFMKIAFDTKLLKKRTMRIFFMVEVVSFLGLYFFGAGGIQYLTKLQEEQIEIDTQLKTVHDEVAILNEQIEKWKSTPFYKEKIAREQLQMARAGDEIYYIG